MRVLTDPKLLAAGALCALLGGCAGSPERDAFRYDASRVNGPVDQRPSSGRAHDQYAPAPDSADPYCGEGMSIKFNTFPFSLSCRMRGGL